MYAKLTLAVWWATLALEAVVLVRSFKHKIVRDYPLFFVYLACVFISSASGYVVYVLLPPLYQYWYWSWELVCVIAGYGVVLEILEKALAFFPGPRRIAKNTALLVLASITCVMAVQWALKHGAGSLRTSFEVDRNLRAAECVLFAMIVSVIFYYGIPIGKNLKGIAGGYGLCVATLMMGYAAGSYFGKSFQAKFSILSGCSYFVSLLIWASALWHRSPNPVPQTHPRLNDDYDALVKWTKAALNGMRGRLEKVDS